MECIGYMGGLEGLEGIGRKKDWKDWRNWKDWKESPADTFIEIDKLSTSLIQLPYKRYDTKRKQEHSLAEKLIKLYF